MQKTTFRNTDQIASFIADRVSFEAANVTGLKVAWGLNKHGSQLSGEDLALFDKQSPVIDYIVYSYRTPIAWHTKDGWVIPDAKYSVTTSKHQGKIRYAIAKGK